MLIFKHKNYKLPDVTGNQPVTVPTLVLYVGTSYIHIKIIPSTQIPLGLSCNKQAYVETQKPHGHCAKHQKHTIISIHLLKNFNHSTKHQWEN